MSNVAETVQKGLAHHQAGRLKEAEQLYRQALAAEPNHAGARHLIGLVALQSGQPQAAIEHISAAIRLNGGQAAFHCNLAEALRATGRLDDAVRAYRQAMSLDPNLAAAHNNLGTVLEAQGNLPGALDCYRRAIELKSDYPDAYNNLGIALEKQGDWQAAVECFRRAIAYQPRYVRGYYNLGVNLAKRNELEQAVTAFQQAIELAPQYADAHYGLALALQKLGAGSQAIAAYERALRLRPKWPEAALSLGALYQAAGQLDAAEAMYNQALQANPNYAEAHYNLGTLLKQREKFDAAIDKYRDAIRVRPELAEAHYNLGTLLQLGEKLPEAAAAYEEAVRLRPDYALALNNLGNVYRAQKRIDEAITCYERALALDPASGDARVNLGSAWHAKGELGRSVACYQQAVAVDSESADLYNNLGTALQDLGRDDEALECFNRSIALDPQMAEPHYNRSLIYLRRRRFADGWAEFGWRHQCKRYPLRQFAQPLWDGGPQPGATLLVHAEQGLGDTLQFVRFVRAAASRVGRVVLAAQRPLVPLLRQSGFAEAMAIDDELPAFEAHLPLMQLPSTLVRDETDLAMAEPYLSADPERVAKWRSRLAGTPGYRVGIAWQGNPEYFSDRVRSIPLEKFAPLAELSGVQLVSLQKGFGSEQVARLADRLPIEDFAAELDVEGGAFLDTAALMQSLDLVVTSDTATAHLAGALGVPVWVALATIADWRWFQEIEYSPWYPSMRLFRQATAGDWDEVFARIRDALQARIDER